MTSKSQSAFEELRNFFFFFNFQFYFSVFLKVDREVCEWGGYINGHILENMD